MFGILFSGNGQNKHKKHKGTMMMHFRSGQPTRLSYFITFLIQTKYTDSFLVFISYYNLHFSFFFINTATKIVLYYLCKFSYKWRCIVLIKADGNMARLLFTSHWKRNPELQKYMVWKYTYLFNFIMKHTSSNHRKFIVCK